MLVDQLRGDITVDYVQLQIVTRFSAKEELFAQALRSCGDFAGGHSQ